MEGEFIQMKNRLPEVIVFAGPNGSGKTTITCMAKTIGVYINGDDIKKSNSCSDLEAAIKAEELRESMVDALISHLKRYFQLKTHVIVVLLSYLYTTFFKNFTD